MKSKYDKHKLTTLTELQAPDFKQALKECGGVMHVCEHSNIPLTCGSGVTA